MNKKPKLLISECLCGVSCRYDGKDNYIEKLPLLKEVFDLVPVCPEVLGGLSTPRDPAERQGERICTANGTDVTKEFLIGAQNTLDIAFQNGCNRALMKAKSPSCGYKRIYERRCRSHKSDRGRGAKKRFKLFAGRGKPPAFNEKSD